MSLQTLSMAQAYVDLGWSIIPLKPRSRQPYFERLLAAGYHKIDEPTVGGWYRAQNELPTPQTLHTWFAANNAGMAVVAGSVSGNLVALDFDEPESYREWGNAHKSLVNSTPVQKSANGYHVFITCPQTKGGNIWMGENGSRRHVGEVKGEGLCVTCAPSIHWKKGVPYKWLRPPQDGIAVVDSLAEIDISLQREPDQHYQSRPVGPFNFRASANDVERAKKLIRQLSVWRADDYDAWLRVGMAMTSLGVDGLELWHEFSARSDKYDPQELDKKWASFGRGDGLTLGSLHYWASQDGGASGWKTL